MSAPDLFPGAADVPDWVAMLALIVGIPLLALLALLLLAKSVLHRQDADVSHLDRLDTPRPPMSDDADLDAQLATIPDHLDEQARADRAREICIAYFSRKDAR